MSEENKFPIKLGRAQTEHFKELQHRRIALLAAEEGFLRAQVALHKELSRENEKAWAAISLGYEIDLRKEPLEIHWADGDEFAYIVKKDDAQ